MKKLFFSVLALTLMNSVNSQINTATGGSTAVLANSPTTNTNVGIGTNVPKSKLDVEGGVSIGVNYSGSIVAPTNGAIIEGNVGIGTSSPKAKLDISGGPTNNQNYVDYIDRNSKCKLLGAGNHIDGGSMFTVLDFPVSNINSKSQIWFGIEDRADFGRYRFIADTGGSTQMSVLDKTQSNVFQVYDDGNNKTTVTLPKSNSYLGIGTSSFVDGIDTYRLSVKGAIRADRVRVYTTWADYVFKKDYNLPTLEEVEKHIQINGHLKDIPSAKEVETKGIELGEMNKLLLQKVEELTLYMIEMNKEIQILKSQLKEK